MYRLKEFIDDIGKNRVINKDIKVLDDAVFVKTSGINFMYKNQAWFQFTDRWVDLQGGVPYYITENNLDEKLFEEIRSE